MSNGEIVSPEARAGQRPNHFAGGEIDRAATRRGDIDWVMDNRANPEALVIPVRGQRSLVSRLEDEESGYDPVFLSPAAARSVTEEEEEWVFLGLDGDRPVFAARVIEEEQRSALASVGEFQDLHRVGALLGQADGALLAYARAVTTWSLRHRFCGSCGHPTQPVDGGHVRRCSNELCEEQHFPRTDPAIIVLVADGDRCLLGRKDIWPDGVYSTLAGFVEPGESLSEAVVREVREESGIEVGDVRYRSSQPWPFPASLMLGFRAVRTGGDLQLDGEELEDARWFHRDDFSRRREIGLRLPSRVSIARRLIQDWLDDET